MTEKENIMLALDGETPEWTPCYWNGAQIVLSNGARNVPPLGTPEGYDGFGVHHTATENTGWMFTPSPGKPYVLTDITKWREQVTIPNVDDIDWPEMAKSDMLALGIDPVNKAVDYYHGTGLFERIHFLMGVEAAMEAIVLEPDAVYDLAGAIADYHIEVAKKVNEYYKPDYYTFLDDYAHMRGLFISPKAFDTLFAPHLKRIIDYVETTPMKFKTHCCGKIEMLLDNFYDLGVRRFDPCQPCNDLLAMKKRHPDIALMGGLDLQGCVDLCDITEEKVRAEVRRCIDEYGPLGSYTVFGASVSMYDPTSFAPGGKMWWICDEASKYAKKA